MAILRFMGHDVATTQGDCVVCKRIDVMLLFGACDRCSWDTGMYYDSGVMMNPLKDIAWIPGNVQELQEIATEYFNSRK